MKESKVNQEKNYYVTSGDIREIDVIHEDFFEAVDAAIRQLVNIEEIDINKLNVSITRAYVELPNASRVYKLVRFVGTNMYELLQEADRLQKDGQPHELLRYDGHLYFIKFVHSVIVNLED